MLRELDARRVWHPYAPMPGRVLHGADLTRFTAGAKPVTDENALPSPAPPTDAFVG